MTTRDLKSNIAVTQSLAPAARTAAANGTGVYTRGYESAVFEFSFGAVSDGYFVGVCEESDSESSGFTTVAAADLDGSPPTAFGGSPASGAGTTTRVGYKGNKPYIRTSVTQGLSPAPVTGAVVGGNIILGHPHGAPQA